MGALIMKTTPQKYALLLSVSLALAACGGGGGGGGGDESTETPGAGAGAGLAFVRLFCLGGMAIVSYVLQNETAYIQLSRLF